MKRMIRSPLHYAGWLAALSVCFTVAPAAAERKDPPASSRDSFLRGAPFTFEQILKLVSQDAIPLHRRKEAIQNRGLDFSLTQAQLEKLRAAGASEDLLRLIRAKARPATVVAAVAVAPKKEPVGAIDASCEPEECDISLNGTPLGSTKGGRMEMARLRPGKWVVDFSAKGYISHQSVARVDADQTVAVAAVLEPNHATQEALGANLLKKVILALGGEEGMKELTCVQASGSTTIWSQQGGSVRWTLLMRNNPDRALFQAKAGKILHEVEFVGSEFKASKNLKGQDALEMPTDFGFIRDYQITAVLAKVSDPQFKLVASHTLPAADEEYSLFADNGTQKIAIGLDSALRPQRVRVTTATGVGSVAVTYSDYFKGQKASYPKSMQIKPDGWQHGIDVQFDRVELSPMLTASDYKLRGKLLLNLEK